MRGGQGYMRLCESGGPIPNHLMNCSRGCLQHLVHQVIGYRAMKSQRFGFELAEQVRAF